MGFVMQLLTIFAIAVVALVIYNFARPFIFTKIRPNKWVLIILLVVLFFLPMAFPVIYSNFIGSTVFFILITLLALTFVDALKVEKAEKNRPIVGKPKAKPHRAKKNK